MNEPGPVSARWECAEKWQLTLATVNCHLHRKMARVRGKEDRVVRWRELCAVIAPFCRPASRLIVGVSPKPVS